MTDFGTSVLRRYCVGVASALLAVAASAGLAQAGGWEEFLDRCVVPMEAGGDPKVIGLELVNEDPIGQAFALPGEAHIAVRPAFGEFGLQCLVVTKPVKVAQDAFDAWIDTVMVVGRYAPDAEIQSRWLTSEDVEAPMAMDVWQEGDRMVFQLSYLEGQS